MARQACIRSRLQPLVCVRAGAHHSAPLDPAVRPGVEAGAPMFVVHSDGLALSLLVVNMFLWGTFGVFFKWTTLPFPACCETRTAVEPATRRDHP